MVMNITDLKKIIQERVLSLLDHKNLEDLDYFKSTPSTAENIAVFIWRQLKPVLGDLLYKITLDETMNNSVTYKGE
jgi:6-pyruvoyltetrahydropterin/6-carboxytetrahydropterin synthase